MSASAERVRSVGKNSGDNGKRTEFGKHLRWKNVGFDKKKSRDSQYKKNAGNVYEGQGFADKRKREIVREYAKQSKRRESNRLTLNDSQLKNTTTPTFKVDTLMNQGQSKMGSFQKAKVEYKQRMEIKEKKLQEISKCKEEREAALKRYEEKKLQRRRKLLKFTKKGQPIMKGRIELLLETLQRQLASENESHT